MKLFKNLLSFPPYDELDLSDLSARNMLKQLNSKSLRIGTGNQAIWLALYDLLLRIEKLEKKQDLEKM